MKKNKLLLGVIILCLFISDKLIAHCGHCKNEEEYLLAFCGSGVCAEQHEHKKEAKPQQKVWTKEYFYATVYTCPMHPEVQNDKPGNCPKCGMKLEKKQVLMTYACPEENCEYQKTEPGKCPSDGKELVKCEVKSYCPKCGAQVDPQELIKPKKGEIKLRNITQDEIGKKTFCPVMKKEFVVSKKTKAVDYKGNTYYLCCGYCEKEIIKSPEKYISICPKCGQQVGPKDLKLKPIKSAQQTETKQKQEKTTYTCPMCGGDFDEPGKCPKCGMDLIEKK